MTDIFDATYHSKSLKVLSVLLSHDNYLFLLRRPDSASLAVLDNFFEMAEIFIEHRFYIRRVPDRDTHPLAYAVSKNAFSTVQLILQKFPDLINVSDRRRRNVLFYAESVEMVELLLSFGAKAEAIDHHLNSPFTYHVMNGRPLVARSILPLQSRLGLLIRIKDNALAKNVHFVTPRNYLLENAYYSLFSTLKRNGFSLVPQIGFRDEDAIDAGGLFRDWASGIAERLFNAPLKQAQRRYYSEPKAFICPSHLVSVYTLFGAGFRLFNEAPFVLNDDQLYITNSKFDGPEDVYKFIGYFLAICLLKKVSFGVRLAPSILKRILGLHLNFEDLRDDESQIYKSLLDLRNPNFDFDAAEIYFSSSPGVKVNRGNVEAFLKERAEEIMVHRHQNRLNDIKFAFSKALNCQISQLHAHLSWQELSDLFYGTPEVSAADLKAGMIIVRPIDENYALIEKLFFAIDSMNQTALQKLIKFITGSENLPFGGVKALGRPIVVNKSVDDNFRAGTCFFDFFIPTQVESSEEFLERLLDTIFLSDGFQDRIYQIGVHL